MTIRGLRNNFALQLKPSRFYLIVHSALLCGVFGAVIFTPTSDHFLRAIVLLACIAFFFFKLRRWRKIAIAERLVCAANRFTLVIDNNKMPVELRSIPVLSHWLVVMVFYSHPLDRRHFVPIFFDSVDAQNFHLLRVYCQLIKLEHRR